MGFGNPVSLEIETAIVKKKYLDYSPSTYLALEGAKHRIIKRIRLPLCNINGFRKTNGTRGVRTATF